MFKTICVISFILFTSFARASQEECYLGIQQANIKFKNEVEMVFADMKNSGHWLFFKMKKDHKPTLEQGAEINRVGRICMKAGFSYNLYTGTIGEDKPKKHCQVTNINTLAMTCDLFSLDKAPETIKIKDK